MNMNIGKHCLLEAIGAFTLYKSVQFGMQSYSSNLKEKEPVKLSEWDTNKLTQLCKETSLSLYKDFFLTVGGISAYSIFTTSLRNYSANVGAAMLPRPTFISRIIPIGGLAILVPLLLPPSTSQSKVIDVASFESLDKCNMTTETRHVFFYPILKTVLFHKLLFLRIYPLCGALPAHIVTSTVNVAATISSGTLTLNEALTTFFHSVLTQWLFFSSGGRVIYSLMFQQLDKNKTESYRFSKEPIIIEHSSIWRCAAFAEANAYVHFSCVPVRGRKLLRVILSESPPDKETRENIIEDLSKANFAVEKAAERALHRFASTGDDNYRGLKLLDAIDFMFSFRSAAAKFKFNAHTSSLSSSSSYLNGAIETTTTGMSFLGELVSTFKMDAIYIEGVLKYKDGMNLEDMKKFMLSEMLDMHHRMPPDAVINEVESIMYEIWEDHDNPSEENHCNSLEMILDEVYREIIAVQVEDCVNLAQALFSNKIISPELLSKVEEYVEGSEELGLDCCVGPSHSVCGTGVTSPSHEEDNRLEDDLFNRGYNPIHGHISALTRRRVISTLLPYGLTARRFLLLLHQAEQNGKSSLESKQKSLHRHVSSSIYKKSLRNKILKNIEESI